MKYNLSKFSISGHLFIALLFFLSCNGKVETPGTSDPEISFRVEPAPEWTALFKRDSGWFGGDGIFAIPFSGIDQSQPESEDSILFVFSDTMVGEIHEDKLQSGYKMVNNSVAVLKGRKPEGSKIRFLVAENQAAVFMPKTPAASKDEYYWLGDGFVNHQKDQNLYIFAYRIRNTHEDEKFPFREVGNTLIAVPNDSKFPFEEHRQMDIPFFSSAPDSAYSSLGAGILVNTAAAGALNPDGYVYIYGIRGKAKELIAARVSPEAIEDFSSWQFWNGGNWTKNVKEVSVLTDSVSNELSVSPIGSNQYALIYQYGGIFPSIYMQTGPSPVGPFGPRRKIWDTTHDIKDPDLFTYNAKAHPAISKAGELLVSYNVNSFEFFDVIESNPHLYRPRFIRIIFDKK